MTETPDTPTLVVYSGATTVDLARLDALVRELDASLARIQGAVRALWMARLLVGGAAGLAPFTGAATLACLEADAGAALADLEALVVGLRERVVTASAVYSEAEYTAAAVLVRHHAAAPWFAILHPPPLLAGIPGMVNGSVWLACEMVEIVQDVRRGVPLLVNVQGRLRDGATVLGPINPQLLQWAGISPRTPVEALAAAALRITRLDRVGGDVDVWTTGTAGTRHESTIRAGEVTVQSAVPLGAAVTIPALRSVGDVLGRLRSTAAQADRSGVGRIELVAQRGAGGTTAWTVILPGTRETFLAANPQDHLTNVQLVGGVRDDLLLAAKQALAMMPIAEGDPVVFVGHSQGGIAAAELAADPGVRQRFEVAGVVTVGSPVGQVQIPESVPVISVENVDDVIPALDGLANPVGPHRVTLQFEVGPASAGLGPHDVRTYQLAYEQALAQQADASFTAADAQLRGAAHWSDSEATARVYTVEFARRHRLWSAVRASFPGGTFLR